jgi:nucleotide-binding universal stress UspA family protein
MALLESTTAIALNNILWATDLSASSEIALPYVLALARRYGARVYVTHVVPTNSATLLPQRINSDFFEERRRRAEKMVMDLDSSGRLHGVRHLVLIREGEPAETLRRTILDYDIDLIIIGTRGRSGTKKRLLSSVAKELVRQSSCPVLTIGPRCSGDVAWAGTFRNILCATDLSPEARAASDCAFSLARQHQARLTLLHIPKSITAGTQEGKALLKKDFRRRLEELVRDGGEKCRDVKIVVECGAPSIRILEVVNAQQTDLIVLGTRRTDDWVQPSPSSTAYPVISNASCPVLSVPAICDRAGNQEDRIAA